MTKTNDSHLYYRMGAALPIRHKELFHARLAELGLKTLGDLVVLFVEGEGVVSALAPIAATSRKVAGNKGPNKADLIKEMREFSPEEIKSALELLKQSKVA